MEVVNQNQIDDIIINTNIDSLIETLSATHLIHLNDNMLLIKLHRNSKFNDWLNTKNIMPKYKKYHNSNNRMRLNILQQIGAPATPQFITICLIPDIANKNISFTCCGLNLNNLHTFDDKNS